MVISDEQFFRIFNPMAARRLESLQRNQFDLAHYTSASNALRILRDQSVTLRNAVLMNDFLEIEHGENCLISAWKSMIGKGSHENTNGRLVKVLNTISPTIAPALEQLFDGRRSDRKTDTYLLSLAEHDDRTEGTIGRLSMWRAYGGRTNVALIVNPIEAIAGEASGLFSSPVHYCSNESFIAEQFEDLVSAFESNASELATIDRDRIVHHLNWVFNSLAVSVKHPGFEEEREWRIMYAPWLYHDESITRRVLDIQGIPQTVAQFTLDKSPSATGPRATHRILKKIIVGPTENPWVLYDAFCRELEALGFQDASERVVVSNIPIRR